MSFLFFRAAPVGIAHTRHRRLLPVLGLLFLSGCASVPRDAGFDRISADTKTQLGAQLHWYRGGDADAKAKAAVQRLLKEPLTLAAAVQVALLNNQRLQATYEDIGVAQADLVQAGLLRNPVFGFQALYSEEGGRPSLDIDLVFDFLDLLMIPARKKIAEADFDATSARVQGEVLDLAGRVRRAYYGAQAAAQLKALYREIAESTRVSLLAAQRLRKAGNINKGTLDQHRLRNAEAIMSQLEADAAMVAARETLTVLMGLETGQADWRIRPSLPRIPGKPLDLAELEQVAVKASLELVSARKRVVAMEQRLGMSVTKSIISDLEIGAVWEREHSGEKSRGPLIEVALPIFDHGQGRKRKAMAELRRARALHQAALVETQAAARSVIERLRTQRARVVHLLDQLLPLNRSVFGYTLLEYNAMQVGVFDLMRAYERGVSTRQRFIQALRDYWLARADRDTLLSGRNVSVQAAAMMPAASMGAGDGDGGH